MLITRSIFVRSDTGQCLDEPRTDSVVAIMQLATFAVPFFPGEGSTVVYHVEIARISALLQHAVHEFRFLVLSSPLGEDRDTYQARSDVTTETSG